MIEYAAQRQIALDSLWSIVSQEDDKDVRQYAVASLIRIGDLDVAVQLYSFAASSESNNLLDAIIVAYVSVTYGDPFLRMVDVIQKLDRDDRLRFLRLLSNAANRYNRKANNIIRKTLEHFSYEDPERRIRATAGRRIWFSSREKRLISIAYIALGVSTIIALSFW